MASQIVIRGNGVVLHLAGSGLPHDGSIDGWEDQATSPYRLSMNEATGNVWTPTIATPLPYGRGYTRYGEVQEVVGVQGYADSHDNAVTLIHRLRQFLGYTGTAPILQVQPDGATDPVYFTLGDVVVQELPQFINEEAGNFVVRFAVSWTRSPFAGRLATWDTLANATQIKNTGAATLGVGPDNVVAMTSFVGDMVTEGQPLNVTVDNAGYTAWAAPIETLILATVIDTTSTYVTNTSSLSTTSVAGELKATITGIPSSPLLTRADVKGRIMARTTGGGASLEIQARVALGNTDPFHVGPWVQAVGDVYLDLGPVESPLYDLTVSGSPTLQITIYARSLSGASTGGAMVSVQWLNCLTFGKSSAMTASRFVLETFVARAARPALPMPARIRSSTSSAAFGVWRGEAPRFTSSGSNAQLFVAWSGAATEQADVTITHAPLWRSFAGEDA